MKLAYAAEMRQLDQTAINEYGIPGIILMENAGVSTINAMVTEYGPLNGRTVVIFSGPGNNGGDGLVIARHVLQHQGNPLVFLLGSPDKLKGDPAINFNIIGKSKILYYPVNSSERLQTVENCLAECDLVVDAIFGTGLTRKVRGLSGEVIDLINQAPCPVISADIPSGLDSDTGLPLGKNVRADLTVTYGLAKPGHFIGIGPEVTGKLGIADIGIPWEIVERANLAVEVLDGQAIQPLLPIRSRQDHKGSYGHILILAGSPGKTGAAHLCARGALRAGSGLVSLAIPQALVPIAAAGLPELMTLPLSSSRNNRPGPTNAQEIKDSLIGKKALVAGPGLGTAPETGELVNQLYQQCECPMVVDADALNLLARGPQGPGSHSGPRILTPHPGEMGRLTGQATAAIQQDRLNIAREFAVKHQVIVVLKGASTVVATPGGELSINPTGNPLLATGGTGDVLAGIIGALLAQGLAPASAARLGVFAHGRSADNLADQRKARSGILASELADALPLTLAELY